MLHSFLLAQRHSGLLHLLLAKSVITQLKASMRFMTGLIGQYLKSRHIHILLSILSLRAAAAVVALTAVITLAAAAAAAREDTARPLLAKTQVAEQAQRLCLLLTRPQATQSPLARVARDIQTAEILFLGALHQLVAARVEAVAMARLAALAAVAAQAHHLTLIDLEALEPLVKGMRAALVAEPLGGLRVQAVEARVQQVRRQDQKVEMQAAARVLHPLSQDRQQQGPLVVTA